MRADEQEPALERARSASCTSLRLDLTKARQLLNDGLIDLPAFGEPFIANPDLVERFRRDWPLAQADRDYLLW
ncbi:hypothetical protein [Sinorhizobium garamanticum]|uniref:hypothetical protein n=1 Tax=Sinorhizobium garamanticum TaxID=680247 RepID=UPI003CC83EBB